MSNHWTKTITEKLNAFSDEEKAAIEAEALSMNPNPSATDVVLAVFNYQRKQNGSVRQKPPEPQPEVNEEMF